MTVDLLEGPTDPPAEPGAGSSLVADGRSAPGADARRRRVPAVLFLVVGAVAVLAYATSDDVVERAFLYDGSGLVTVGAILVGIAINRPARQAPWLFIALAVACWVAGDILWDYAKLVLEIEPFPWWSDVPYLVGYPILALAFLRVVMPSGRRNSTPALIDTAIVVVGFALAFWVFLVMPALTDPEASGLERLVACLYPIGDVMLLMVIIRVGASLTGVSMAIRFLLAGVVLQVVADAVFAQTYVDLTGSYVPALECMWICGYIAFGSAALHPSMAQRSSPVEPGSDASRMRLALLLVAAMLSPAILVVEWAAGLTIEAPTIAVASAVVFALVVLRIAGLVRALRVTVEDREMLASELRHLALHDMLTGLPNRTVFADRLDHALVQRRKGTDVGVIYLDLDNFKIVNDSHGHAVGDALLKIVAGRIAAAVRAGDTAARLGGDEFAVIVEGVADPGVVGEIANRIRATVEEPVSIGEVRLVPRASVGLTVGTPGRDGPDELLREADMAMYAEKRQRLGDPYPARSTTGSSLVSPARS
jgi:diguanylate cyclase (GGDEF)-like protein